MLGRRTSSRTASAAVARRRLEALEATLPAFPDRAARTVKPDSIEGEAPSDPRQVTVPSPRPRSPGRHAASLAPLRSFALTAQQVTVVALAVAAVVAVAAWWVMRAAPDAEPVELAQERIVPASAQSSVAVVTAGPAGGLAPSPDETTDDAAASPVVVVDVAGKVRRPGIVELPVGSRVVDALREAGGARRGVDTSALNLARVLVDGEQIVVGLVVPTTSSGTIAAGADPGTTAPVNLNTATLEQLETLPGIGPVTAQAILDWRTDNGRFTSVDELLEVSGIGDATLADIEAYVYV
jgi:competence protein ComEA